MFKTPAPDVESAPDQVLSENLVPLSHFQLDHPQPPEGWPAFLGRRAIAFVPDDLGRDCIRRRDARRLLDERRADELRAVKLRQLAEQEAVEADRVKFAQIWQGVSADQMPVGATPASVMLAAAKDAQPKRRTPLEEALSNDGGITYHSYAQPDEE